MAGRAKQVAPAAATGGAGNSFESRVQAHRLLAMCINNASCPGTPDGFKIVAIQFQGRVHGNNTDDLTCLLEDDYGKKARVRLQMKRTLRPRLSDESFKEAVGLAWLDFKSPTFQPGEDFFNVIYDVVSAKDMKAVSELARDAVRSLTAENWELKVTAENFSNDARRSAFYVLQSIVNDYNDAPVSLEELFRFMQHVQFLHEDLDSDETAGAKQLQQTIEIVTKAQGRLSLPASAVWAKLIAVCVELNGCAGEVDAQTVGARLGSDLDYRFKAFAMGQSIAAPQASAMAADVSSAAPQVSFTIAAERGGGSLSTVTDLIPAARDSSANKLVSRMLDRVRDLIKTCKFSDAKAALQQIREDTDEQPLDTHQDARWYSMYASCVWIADGDEQSAADNFIRAADLYEDDEKLAAARIRGLLLKMRVPEAMDAARNASSRFPDSLAVWVSWTNVKIEGGDLITVADIPAIHGDKSAAYQIVSASLHKAGDVEGALEVALKGLRTEDASFFIREAVLRYALELATANPVHLAYRVGAGPHLDILRQAVNEFLPRETRLWSVQVPDSLTAAARHLCYAHLVLAEPLQALEVALEAARRPLDQKALIRPHLEALRDLGRTGDAMALGSPLLDTMPLDALVTFVQTAIDGDDIAHLMQGIDAGNKRASEESDSRFKETLRLMQWESLLQQGEAKEVARQVTELDALVSGSLPVLVFGARAFLTYQDDNFPGLSNDYIAKAIVAERTESDPANAYLMAQLMMQARRYAEAAERYEKILPSGALSVLHTNLLVCYMRLGLRAKARDLIGSFPERWRKDRLARHLAMELGQQAGDWELLQTLVAPQLDDEALLAKSWLYALMVAAHTAPETMDEVTSKFPRILEGTIREAAQAASAEFQHGQRGKGLARLYRMRRLNMSSTDAAAALHAAVALSPVSLPELYDAPEVVGVGCAVQFTDSAGALRWTTIDPDGFGLLPATEEFINGETPEAKALVGKRLGDEFIVTDALGGKHIFTVVALISPYARLLLLSSLALNTPIAPSTLLTSVQLPTKPDGDVDVEPVLQQLRTKEANTHRLFSGYQDQALTLGMLARAIGTDTVDLVRAWPDEGPLMQVGGGQSEERASAETQLRSGKRTLVALSALTELALIEQLQLLQSAVRPLVTSTTRDAVLQKLAEARIHKPTGTAMSRGGRFHLIEYTDDSRKRDQNFLQSILDAIIQYCEVIPAYGPAVVPSQLPQIASVVSHEEYALIMVALEYDALLLTLDFRLRALASVFKVQSVWPQVFLMFRFGAELPPRDYSIAVLRMFCSRRDFISLNVHDLLVLTDQGEKWMNIGFTRLREQLSVGTSEFDKGWSVVLNYLLALYNRGQCELGAVLEFFTYLLEGLLRHPLCPKDFAMTSAMVIDQNLGDSESVYANRLQEFAQMAVARLHRPLRPVKVRATVIYCSAPPAVRHGLTAGPDPLAGN